MKTTRNIKIPATSGRRYLVLLLKATHRQEKTKGDGTSVILEKGDLLAYHLQYPGKAEARAHIAAAASATGLTPVAICQRDDPRSRDSESRGAWCLPFALYGDSVKGWSARLNASVPGYLPLLKIHPELRLASK